MQQIIKITLLLTLLSGFLFGKSNSFVVGIDATVFAGIVQKSATGKVKSAIGISPGIGIGYKRYLGSGATKETFSYYWGVGTDDLTSPFVTLGGDYIFKGDLKLYIGAGITGRMFLENPLWPYLSVGLYL